MEDKISIIDILKRRDKYDKFADHFGDPHISRNITIKKNNSGKLIYFSDDTGFSKKDFLFKLFLDYDKNDRLIIAEIGKDIVFERKFNDKGHCIYFKISQDFINEYFYDRSYNIIEFYDDSTICNIYDFYKFDPNGNFIYNGIDGGVEYTYDENNVLLSVKNLHEEWGEEWKYNKSGNVIYHKTSIGDIFKYDDNGILIYESHGNPHELYSSEINSEISCIYDKNSFTIYCKGYNEFEEGEYETESSFIGYTKNGFKMHCKDCIKNKEYDLELDYNWNKIKED